MTDLRKAGRKEVEEYSRYLKEERKLTAASVASMRKDALFLFKWLSGVKGLGMKFSEERKEEEEKAKEAVYRLEGPGMPEEFRRGYAEYLRQKVITKTPEGTLEGIRFSLRVFYQYLSERGASSYATIKGEDARDYVKYLTERKVKATGQPLKAVSINRNISDVKSHLKWLHKRGYSRGLWDQLRKLLKEHTVKANVLSRKEIVKLFNIKAERPYDFMIKTVLALLYASGVRIGELLELKRPDIDLTNGEAHIFETKTGKDRAVQLGEVGTTYLKLYLEQVRPLVLPKGSANPYLFVKVMEGTDLKAKRLSIPQMEVYIRKFTKIAGVQKRVSCHTFRHTYGTHLLENGAKTKYVADLLGHKDLGTTEQYLHLSPAHLRETLLKYHPMEA